MHLPSIYKIVSCSTTSRGRIQTDKGFIALIAVVLLISGILVFSATTLGSAVWYADSVERREDRIQARLNAASCLETVKMMAQRNPFIGDYVIVKEFACTAFVSRKPMLIELDISTKYNGVSGYIHGSVLLFY